MARRFVFAVFLLGAVACGEDQSGVTVTGHEFDPSSITISAGDALVWTNGSDESHTVTAYEDGLPDGASVFSSGGFDSETEARANVADGLIRPGETFEVTFDRPGTYRYFCIPHEGEGMKGSVTVE